MAKRKRGLDGINKSLLQNKSTAKKAIEKIAQETPRGKGRPKAEHGRVRFTTLITPEARDYLKLVAVKENCTISDLFQEAAELLVKKYQNKYPSL